MQTLRTSLGGLIAGTLLVSCGIRLPINTRHAERVVVSINSKPADPKTSGKTAPDPDLLVWMIADKYHTGLVFSYAWLLESGYVPPKGFGSPQHVTMSWGNRNAYSEEGIDNTWKMMRVLFSPTPSVMEIIPSNWSVVEVCPHQRIWRKLVRRDTGPALAAFLNDCSRVDAAGRPIVIRKSSWGNGVQLDGRHSYFIPRVCNVWTAQAIECVGGKINPWFGLTADGLAKQIVKPPNDFEKIWDAYPKEKREETNQKNARSPSQRPGVVKVKD